MKKYWVNITAVLLLILMFILEITSASQESQTTDEAVHLMAGYSYLTLHDYRLNAEHPPLTKYLAALPLLFLQPEINTNNPGWQSTDQWKMAPDFLYHNTVDADTMLFWGRIPTIIISLLLGWLIFIWSRKLFGPKAALIALLFYVFCPNVLAHGRLITSDIAIALFFALTFYCLQNYLAKPNQRNLLLFSVVVGLTFLTKFSAPLIFPIIILLLLLKWRQTPDQFPLPKVFLTIFVVLMISLIIIWTGYGFETLKIKDDPFVTYRLGDNAKFLPLTNIPIPAYHYWVGLFKVFFHSAYGQDTYLMGQYSVSGWWYYFPLTFLLKTPLTTLLLLLVLIIAFWQKGLKKLAHFKQIPFHYFILIIPPVIYFLATLFSHLNLGLRHLLPMLPFIFIGIGQMVNWQFFNKKIGAIIFILLMAFYLFTSINIYPHYLAYFNEATGGPNSGPKYLLDSNLDWGQDYKTLKIYLDKNNITEIYFNDTESPKAQYYFKNLKPIPTQEQVKNGNFHGYVAVTVGSLYAKNSYCQWLKKYQPMERIGYSIYLYKFPY